MNTVTVSLPLSKKELLIRLHKAIAENRESDAIDMLRLGYGNWMLAPEEGSVLNLNDLLKFPKEMLIQSILDQMCYQGEVRSFPKFWQMVDSCEGQPWIYELVMLVYANLPYEANPQKTLAKVKEKLGCVPEHLTADNRAKCWSYLDKHPCSPELKRELRRKYSSLLHSNKNKNLCVLLKG